MSKADTHILSFSERQMAEGQPPMQVVTLYRAAGVYAAGMRLATANDVIVQSGEDSQKPTMRVFMTRDFAVAYLRTMADEDWAVLNGVDPGDKDFRKIVASGYSAAIKEVNSNSRVIAATNLAQAAILRH